MVRSALVIVAMLASFGRGVAQTAAPAQTAARSLRPELLLPSGTLLFVGTDDLTALVTRSKSSPMGQVMAEQEVKEFLAKPLGEVRKLIDQGVAMAKQQPGLDTLELDVDKILAGSYGRAFFAITQFDVAFKEGKFDPNSIDVGLVIGLEPRAGAVDVFGLLKQVVAQVAATSANAQAKFESAEVDGLAYERIKNPTAASALCFATVGGMSIVSLSEKSIAALARTAKSATGSLLADPSFTRCAAAVGAPATGDIVAYAQLGRMVEMAGRIAVAAMGASGEKEMTAILEKGLEVSKLASIGPSYSTAQWRDGTSVNISYSEVDPSVGGLLALAARKPVDMNLLKLVPKNALSFSIGSFELAPLWDTVFGALKEAAPAIHEQAMSKIHEFETQVGGADAQGNPNWDIRRDFVGAIGGRTMSINTPGAGSMLGPGADSIFWVETSNPQGLEKSLGFLFAFVNPMLEASSGMKINFKEQLHGDIKLEVLDTMSLGPAAMAAGSVQPTWCIHDGRFWFASTTKAMKKALDAGKPPSAETIGAKPEDAPKPPPPENITAKADFAKRWVDPPAGAVVTSVSYSDTATNFENTYQGLLGLIPYLQMAMSQGGMNELPFDIALLPTGAAISQHLFGTVSVSYRVGDHAHVTQSRGPLGPEAALMMGGLVAIGAGTFAYQREQKAESRRRAALKSVAVAKGDPTEQVKRDFADIGASITVYIIVNNKSPASLDELTKPTPPDYPKGYTQGQPLPVDPWGHAYSYSTDVKDDYKLWSPGPNGIDEQGAGDDIVKRD